MASPFYFYCTMKHVSLDENSMQIPSDEMEDLKQFYDKKFYEEKGTSFSG